MALCCQNRVSRGTGRHYRLHSSASSSVHSPSFTVLGLLKKGEEEEEEEEEEEDEKKKEKELVQTAFLPLSG